MTVYNMSIVHEVYLDDACVGIQVPVSYIGAHDLDLVSGRVTLTITQPGNKVSDPLSGSLIITDTRVQAFRGLPSLTSQRDIDQSDGKIRITDKKFRLSRVDLKFMPKMGDQVLIVGDTVRYEIVAVDDVTQSKAVIAWCRG